MSGAQRLPNGNTLICTGFSGEIFEVTPDKEVVWRFVVPDDASGGPGRFGPPGGVARAGGPGAPPGFGPPGGFDAPTGSVSILPGPLRMMLQLTPDQAQQLDEFEKTASANFDELLTDDQQKQFEAIKADPAQWGPPEEIRIGKILPSDAADKLKLSAEQQQSFSELQSSVDEAMAKIFTDDQREQFKQIEGMIQAFVGGALNFGPTGRGPNFGPPGGGPNFGPPGRDRGGRGPGGFGGPRGFMSGVPGSAAVFRAYRYGVDDPAFAGKDLTPGNTLVEIAEATKNASDNRDEGKSNDAQ
jgi:hypothetical protein